MTRSQYLEDQVERAERLARSALDPLTLDRLNEFAAECREALQCVHRNSELMRPVHLPPGANHLGVWEKHR